MENGFRIRKRTARLLVVAVAVVIACGLAFAVQLRPDTALAQTGGDISSDGGELLPVGKCGDGYCEPYYENKNNCPEDCAPPPKEPGCGPDNPCCDNDGVCESDIGEWNGNCPGDCPSFCGDGVCKPDEVDTCLGDCPVNVTCGDAICSAFENYENCPKDCPQVTEEPTKVVTPVVTQPATEEPTEPTQEPTEEPGECPPGSALAADGSCNQCPENTFSAAPNSPTCDQCPEGTESEAGATECTPVKTEEPTDEPTPVVTEEPTAPPTQEPTQEPTREPTPRPRPGSPVVLGIIILIIVIGVVILIIVLFLSRRKKEEDEEMPDDE